MRSCDGLPLAAVRTVASVTAVGLPDPSTSEASVVLSTRAAYWIVLISAFALS
jgi:hypothetical protein